MLQRLQKEAQLAGGQAVNLLGNHEIMNIMGIYDYVSPEDIQQFGNVTDRIIAFSKDGWVGKYLRKLNVTVYSRTPSSAMEEFPSLGQKRA
ncbi:hypothetical protein DSO57_1034435 [Entomophthora muscae]|uniref:Uncharacterized protein n=1 Tax=Entomophthora muscae TaxID=34485 RepID=A0ACC2RQP4_9FUNG|nr:hypothetical protein DSO57_1034435 [Entomophthora muscae]